MRPDSSLPWQGNKQLKFSLASTVCGKGCGRLPCNLMPYTTSHLSEDSLRKQVAWPPHAPPLPHAALTG